MPDILPVQSISPVTKTNSNMSNSQASADAFEAALQSAQDQLQQQNKMTSQSTSSQSTPAQTHSAPAAQPGSPTADDFQQMLLKGTSNTTPSIAAKLTEPSQTSILQNLAGSANALQSQIQSLSLSSIEEEEAEESSFEEEEVSIEQQAYLDYLNTPAESTDMF